MQLQILDVNYFFDQEDGPVIELYGATRDGLSKTVSVMGFKPYFYANVIPGKEQVTLDKLMHMGLDAELVERFEPIGYQASPRNMIKITANNPRDVRILRDRVMTVAGITAVYEADVLFKNRFLLDHGLGGMAWAEVPEGTYAMHEHIEPVSREDNSPLRIMTFDIECLSRDGTMPTPDKCPVIMVSMAFSPAYDGLENMVLMSNDTHCPRKDVEACDTEESAIWRFIEIIRDYNPDIIGGYNSNGFDFDYLDQRCKKLRIEPRTGRDGSRWQVHTKMNGGKEYQSSKKVIIAGRVVIDLLPIIRANHSLKQYNLKTVARELINQEKLDVPPKQMASLWYGDTQDLAKFVKYARRDAVLVMNLIKELNPLEKYIALSKVSGLLLQDVIDGGQSGMVENLLLRKFMSKGRVMPMKPMETIGNLRDYENVNLKGGEVLDPVVGLQEDVAILDYKSLYPTLMIAYNLCFSTVLLDRVPMTENTITSPHGGMFVPPAICKGIIPETLEWLLDQRLTAKKAMKASVVPSERALLDAKQYAYKILLNSFYGYSGYARARLYCLDVANAVTSFGRANIKKTVSLIQDLKRVQIKKGEVMPGGHQYGLQVVYGDTDSVFIRIQGCNQNPDLAEQIGSFVAKKATEQLPAPMELVFEAYAGRALFLAKKHYAMWRFERQGGEWVDKIKAKGIETVRRDWCELTSDTLKSCLEKILREGDCAGAVKLSQDTIKRIKSMDLQKDPDLLPKITLTKKFSRPIDSYKQKQPHVELIKKLKARGTMEYGIGDRIPFIVVHRPKKVQFVNRAEDPKYAIEHGEKIDVQYYINKQLVPPLARLFEPLGISEDKLVYGHTQMTCNDLEKVEA